jgi:hypothetical protein
VPQAVPPPQLVLGRLVGFDDATRPLIDFEGNALGPLPAAATASYGADQLGSDVVLLFIEGDPARPLILGCLCANAEVGRIALTAKRELELRCGRASITLTASGKIIIDGAYVSSRSTGVNRLRGAAVQIN